jgi:hypothetical protein
LFFLQHLEKTQPRLSKLILEYSALPGSIFSELTENVHARLQQPAASEPSDTLASDVNAHQPAQPKGSLPKNMSSASLYSTGSAHQYASSQGDQVFDVADEDDTEPKVADSAIAVHTLTEPAPQYKPDATCTAASSASTTTGATDYDSLFLSHTAATDASTDKKRKHSADTADNEGEGTSGIRSSKTSKAPTGVIKLKASKDKATGSGSGGKSSGGLAGTDKPGREVKKVKKSDKKTGKKGGGGPADDIDDIFGGL